MATLLPAKPASSLVLAGAIDAQRQALLEGLNRSEKLKGKRVHDLRVACRRLLVALDLAGAAGQHVEPRTTKHLKRLLKGLSPLRDAEVQLRGLEPLAQTYPQTRHLGELLREQKPELQRAAQRELAALEVDDLSDELSRVAKALTEGPHDASPTGALDAALTGELARRHLRVTEDWQHASADDPRSLHRVRLGLKGYRYALEALRPLLPAPARELAQRIARLQDQLGSAHDAHVLAETARRSAKTQGKQRRQQLTTLADELEKTSQAAHQNSTATLRGTQLAWPMAGLLGRQ